MLHLVTKYHQQFFASFFGRQALIEVHSAEDGGERSGRDDVGQEGVVGRNVGRITKETLEKKVIILMAGAKHGRSSSE